MNEQGHHATAIAGRMRLALRPSMTPKPRLGHMDFTVRSVRAAPELLGAGRCDQDWPAIADRLALEC